MLCTAMLMLLNVEVKQQTNIDNIMYIEEDAEDDEEASNIPNVVITGESVVVLIDDTKELDILCEEKRMEIMAERACYSEQDLNFLARIIYAEARGSTEEDMLLVGNVVLNRVISDQYPDTIEKVIFQKGQYSPVKNGKLSEDYSEVTLGYARRLLEGERFCPDNVVYQSQSKQGSGVWKKVEKHYYCFE